MPTTSEPAPNPWRLIIDGPQSGARNMATDEALARAHLESQAPPTLRFYDWEPRCLSLGRLQKLEGPLQVLAGRRAGLDWVRRPSGGRAVWHEAEVTYSMSLNVESLPEDARSLVGAYEWLSRPLLRGLQSLGVRAEIASGKGHDRHERNCFLSSSQADAVVGGRKLIGGAQCRFEQGGRASVLQHGSILIALNSRSWTRALGENAFSERLSHMEMHMLSLRDLTIEGRVPEVRVRVQEAIVHALREEAEVEQSTLSPREEKLRDDLERYKYLQGSWNQRGRLAS